MCLLQSVVRNGDRHRTRRCWRPTRLQTTLMSACPTSSLPMSSKEFSVIFLSLGQTNLTSVSYQGVAYISGVCKNYAWTQLEFSKSTKGYLSPNTGFVTFAGNSLSSTPVLTFGHEVGHNLGAPHDGDNNHCDARKYMMAAYAQTLPKDHSKIFSKCSKDSFKSELTNMVKV